jgi:hypothetical protein
MDDTGNIHLSDLKKIYKIDTVKFIAATIINTI